MQATDQEGQWDLKIYILGETPTALKAIDNLRKICDEHLKGRYSIEVVDLQKNPQLAEEEKIIAVPTVVRKLPPPLRKLIGDLSEVEKVLVGLDIRPRK